MPHHEAGSRTEPPVSVPIAAGASPAETATPEPLDEPPGVRWTVASQGFHGVPMCVLVPQPPMANSTVCVLPSTIMPALMNRRASVAVTADTRLAHTLEPPVVTRPGGQPRVGAVDVDVGVQPGVELVDTRQQRVHDIHG